MKHPLPNAFARLCRRIVPAALLLLGLCQSAWAAAPFTVNANGTVTDTTTSLVWDQCVYGKSGTDCATVTTPALGSWTSVVGSWSAALTAATEANAANYKGFNDWRLPNKNELESITKIDTYTVGQPAIDTVAFPNTPITGDSWGWGGTWTSTTYAPVPSYAWIVYFVNGFTNAAFKDVSSFVRLVRSGQSFASFDAFAASQTITGFNPASPVVFGAAAATLSATGGASGQPVVFSTSSLASVCTTSGTNGATLTYTGVGTCNLTANQAGNGSYNAAPQVTASVTINSPISQSITGFNPASPVVFGAAAATLSATGGASGQPVVFSTSSLASICTTTGTNGATLTYTGVGLCSLTANQAAGGIYSAAPQVTASIVINAVPSKTVTGASPTGPGNITAAFTGGNGSCAYATSQFGTQTPPTGVALTYGVFNFTTNDCGAGSALSFTITYPQTLPSGTRYYKYGPEFGASQTPHWYVLPGAVVSGNQISFTITDNGAGDSNPAAGFITDPGGPGVPATTTLTEPITLEVPVAPLIPPLASLPALPGVGNSGRTFLNLAEGAGPSMTGCLRTTLNDLLGPDWVYQGQSADGGVRLKRAADIISFYPIEANSNTTYGLGQGAGVYLRTTNPLSVVTGCGTFVTAPALYSLGEFGALLNAGGLTAQINAQGVITYPTGTLTYAVRPGYWVTQGNPGAPALTTGADGQLRFTDSAGLSQILYPAFLDPELLGSQVSQAVGGWTAIQTDGTALVTLWGGQQFVLTPDLALGTVPAGTMTVWWQDGPNHYSLRNSGFSNTSQGFSVTPR